MDFITRLFDSSDFPARWTCGDWSAGHGWLHILSDLGVWSAYMAIPLVLLYFFVRRKDLPFRGVFFLFGAFIFFCGMTHLVDAIIFWWPVYRVSGVFKFLTAVVSWATVLALVPIVPRAMSLRSPEELEREVAARKLAEAALLQANSELEERVALRTTELRLAMAVIADERELLRITLASIGDAVIATDTQGQVTNMNGVAESLTGWTTAESKGRPLDEVFHIVNQDTRQPVLNPATRALEEGVIVGLANHTILIAKDGTEWPIDDSAAPIRMKDGELVGCVLCFRDVSERTRQEAALLQSEERYRATFASAPVGIAHMGLDGRWLRFNDAVCAITGYEREKLATRTFADITHPEDLEADWSLVRQVLAGEIARYSMEKRYIREDGGIVWVNLTVSLLRDPAGTPVNFISVIEDITERRRADVELANREAHLRRVINNQLGLVGVIDRDGILLEVDERSLAIAKARRQQVIGKHFADAPWWNYDPEVAGQMREAMQKAMAGEVIRYDVSLFAHGDDGVMIDFMIAPVFGDDGEVEYLIPSGVDIRERYAAEQQLKKFNEHLEHLVVERTAQVKYRSVQLRALAAQLTEAEQKERQRIAMILHDDLQQLLVATRFQIGILRKHLPEAIHRERLSKLDMLLEDSLNATRSLTIDLSPPILQQGNMAQVLKWLAQWFSDKHGLSVDVKADEEAQPRSQEVRVMLFNVVREMLFNVVKHGKTDRASLELSSTRNDQVRVVISDAGVGFDPSQPRNESNVGTGLGLFSIKERLDWIGGTFEIKSAPGQGTRATIIAPKNAKTPQNPEPASNGIMATT